jgi:biopolymer transport protein TolR
MKGLKKGGAHSSAHTTLSEINVTPFVDVMLVLLIVFMVSAPLLQQGIDVNLPKVKADSLPQTEEPIVLTVINSQNFKLDGKTISKSTLQSKLEKLARSGNRPQVLVQADKKVAYGTVIEVMADIKNAGIKQVGLVTSPLDP